MRTISRTPLLVAWGVIVYPPSCREIGLKPKHRNAQKSKQVRHR